MNQDERFMQLALQLAAAAKGATSPNPLVGAVIVNNEQVIGMGAHLRAGDPHAEVHALHVAGVKAKGATMYVTLEPCSHYGRTPPCVDQVIEAGIAKVIIATTDPNPRVSGRGVKKLQEAGIDVKVGVLQKEAEQLNEAYNCFMLTGQPLVTLKTATTLDGKIATVTGESQWITSEEARADVHLLRHEHDALLVGVGTVLKDDPYLTTRLEGKAGAHPVRIVLDSCLRTPLDAHVTEVQDAQTWIFTTNQADPQRVKQLEDKGIRVFQTERAQWNIEHVLQKLGEAKITSLLVEGGGEVNASFLEGNHVHKIVAYVAPTLIGGNEAPTPFRGTGFSQLSEAVQLENVQVQQVGRDLKMTGDIGGKKDVYRHYRGNGYNSRYQANE